MFVLIKIFNEIKIKDLNVSKVIQKDEIILEIIGLKILTCDSDPAETEYKNVVFLFLLLSL